VAELEALDRKRLMAISTLRIKNAELTARENEWLDREHLESKLEYVDQWCDTNTDDDPRAVLIGMIEHDDEGYFSDDEDVAITAIIRKKPGEPALVYIESRSGDAVVFVNYTTLKMIPADLDEGE
jgi:hypothetical protein